MLRLVSARADALPTPKLSVSVSTLPRHGGQVCSNFPLSYISRACQHPSRFGAPLRHGVEKHGSLIVSTGRFGKALERAHPQYMGRKNLIEIYELEERKKVFSVDFRRFYASYI